MSQHDIIQFLKKHQSKWYNTKQLSDKLKLPMTTINMNLAKMRKRKEIKEKQVKRIEKRNVPRNVMHYAYKK
jgi:uncharacterized protein YfaT (DUF1175 family)